jgi:prephenate dehydrogenase
MWAGLFEDAHPDLVRALRNTAETLQNAADELERGDVEAIVALMNRTRSWSDA